MTSPGVRIVPIDEVDGLLRTASALSYVLDGGRVDGLQAQVRGADARAQCRWSYEDTEYWRQRELGPLIVRTDGPSALAERFIRDWSPLSAGIVSDASAPFETTQAHWRELRHAILPDGRLALFRSHDPAHLRALMEGMSAAEVDQLLGPAKWWMWRELHAGRDTWYRVEQGGAWQPSAITQAWRITPQQMESLDRHAFAAYVDTATPRLREVVPLLRELEIGQAREKVVLMSQAGRRLGFVQADDLDGYLELVFLHNARCMTPGDVHQTLTDTDRPAWQRLEHARALLQSELPA